MGLGSVGGWLGGCCCCCHCRRLLLIIIIIIIIIFIFIIVIIIITITMILRFSLKAQLPPDGLCFSHVESRLVTQGSGWRSTDNKASITNLWNIKTNSTHGP